ncbi:MAG: histidine kinase [Pararhizobium sp.]
MPSLIRFLVFCGIVAGLIYGGMFALVMYVKPTDREITVRVPTEKLNTQQSAQQP